MRLSTAVLVLTSLSLPNQIQAQVLNLRLVQPDSTSPIVGAFVVMTDSVLGQVASGATDATGSLTLRTPAPGRYLLQIQRVGYTTGQMRGELTEGQELTLVLAPTGSRVVAPPIDGSAEFACGPGAMNDPDLALLWQQARTGLSLTAMPAFQQLYYLQANVSTQQWTPPELPQSPPFYSRVYANPWPIWAPTTKEWSADGFIENRQSFETDPLWHGPDPAFFLADGFLGGYCLRLVGPDAAPVLPWMDGTDQGWIGIAFQPSKPSTPSGSGVVGVLWLDRDTLAPRRLEWSYTDIPDWASGRNAGGRVDVAAVPAGGWFAQRWSWRIPKSGAQSFGKFVGYWEYAGAVYQVQNPAREVVARFGE